MARHHDYTRRAIIDRVNGTGLKIIKLTLNVSILTPGDNYLKWEYLGA
jgi:hypothetical protein